MQDDIEFDAARVEFPSGGITGLEVTPCVALEEPSDGLHNMAEDRRWLELVESSTKPLIRLRLFGWNPPAASIGRNQDESAALNADFCRSEGIPIVRRPTGGRAVFHDRSELTYSIVSNLQILVGTGGILETYRRVAEVLRSALQSVGVEAQLVRSETSPTDRSDPRRRQPCFASVSRYELACNGRKIVGSAQRRLRRAILQHGSMPLEIDYPRMAHVLGTEATTLRRRMVSIREAAGREVGREELAAAVRQAFLHRFSRS